MYAHVYKRFEEDEHKIGSRLMVQNLRFNVIGRYGAVQIETARVYCVLRGV